MAGVAWLLVATCLVHSILRAHGLFYIGCYVHEANFDLSTKGPQFNDVSISKCNELCLNGNYRYFGMVQNICWCGNFYGRLGPLLEHNCNVVCKEDPSEFCGGFHGVNMAPFVVLYNTNVYAVVGTPGLQYIGCFADGSNRDLPVLAANGSMSVSRCLEVCKNKGFPYFGVQRSNECWCGNSYGKQGAKPSAECNMRCSGNISELCGAEDRNGVFTTGISPLKLPAASGALPPTLRDQLVSLINTKYIPSPAGVLLCNDCLIRMWMEQESDAKSKVIDFASRDMAAWILAEKLPLDVQSKMLSLINSSTASSTYFEDFQIHIEDIRANSTAYMGLAKRVGDSVKFAMVTANLGAALTGAKDRFYSLIQPRYASSWRLSTSHLIFRPVFYTDGEINLINRALRSETYRLFGEVLNKITL